MISFFQKEGRKSFPAVRRVEPGSSRDGAAMEEDHRLWLCNAGGRCQFFNIKLINSQIASRRGKETTADVKNVSLVVRFYGLAFWTDRCNASACLGRIVDSGDTGNGKCEQTRDAKHVALSESWCRGRVSGVDVNAPSLMLGLFALIDV